MMFIRLIRLVCGSGGGYLRGVMGVGVKKESRGLELTDGPERRCIFGCEFWLLAGQVGICCVCISILLAYARLLDGNL